MQVLRITVAVALLALWPVMSSHALLQHWGFIHEVHADHDHDHDGGAHEHNSENHALADGDYQKGSHDIQLRRTGGAVPVSDLREVALLSLGSLLEPSVRPSGLAPPGTSPPELIHTWQFLFRTALPVRAPSIAS